MTRLIPWFLAVVIPCSLMAGDKPQYEHEAIRIPPASADEPRRDSVSLEAAEQYLDQGARAWSGARKCISCHTNGTYLVIRPALTARLGPPSKEIREFFVSTLASLKAMEREKLKESTRPAQVIYLAAGLSEWDAHVTKSLSPETADALSLMFEIQLESGTWGSLDCWPPFESDAYHEATVAAMAAATAPGWLDGLPDGATKEAVYRLRRYLQQTPPLHDYSRVLLLWAATRMPDLLSAGQQAELIEMLLRHQRPDGGWSLRTLARPEAWGRGNRADKLKAEPDFANPPSDGHQTGLAIIVLRSAGIPATDARIQNGIAWLKRNQQQSGRWWTRSLNTDSWHFITYSGTAYPLLALTLCDDQPNSESQR